MNMSQRLMLAATNLEQHVKFEALSMLCQQRCCQQEPSQPLCMGQPHERHCCARQDCQLLST